ncbi:hypothetical protein [Nostoc sp.]|uniref:hypothetical protein n=1 Tax=Nostoc sp. TaxID=1180 RepID=UPI002FF50E1C
MQPLEAYNLKAFVFALSYLDAPLPDDVQTKVNQVKIPDDIGKLDAIARNYPPLTEHYQTARQNLKQEAEIRSKGPLPAKINQAAEQQNTEINNILVAIDELDDQNLTEIAQPILNDSDSVTVAKDTWAMIILSLQKPML